MVTLGLFVRLRAKSGKEAELAQFLRQGLELAQQEDKTPVWFAIQFDQSTFAVFDAFATEEGCQAHLDGRIAAALMAKAGDLLAEPPRIEKWEAIGVKLPR
jgi:quinol monooxygenase YgiN